MNMDDGVFFHKSPIRTRVLILIGVILLLGLSGMLFYHFVEGWSYADSFYFASISLSTRGYGELHPEHTSAKIFTVFYLFLGVAFIIYLLSTLVGYFIQYQEPVIKSKFDSFVKKIKPKKKDKWIMVRPRE